MLITLLLYANMTVSATDIHIEMYGETEVDSGSYLYASINPWTFGNLYIVGGENLYIDYYVSYLDDRGPLSSEAVHHFNVTAFYSGTSTTKYDDQVYKTYGQGSGGRTLQVVFNYVQFNEYVDITLLAEVTLGGKAAQDYNETTIYLLQV